MLRTAICALRNEHTTLVDDVADGRRLFWLGSGISRGQVPDLIEMLTRVLMFLRDRAANGPENEIHRDALVHILSTYLPSERSKYEDDRIGWIPVDIEPLRNSYGQVLNTRVGTHESDYLLMTAADLPNTYGAPGLEPGPTHRLIAILIAEGVLKEIASGNWDGLVETAVTNLTGVSDFLNVYVTAEDARNTPPFARIAKFHGCAVLARTDPDNYADKIIATRAQISRFGSSKFAHMRDALKERTRTHRSLILGLSLQDDDLLGVFTGAAEIHPWPWDTASPAYVFAEPNLSDTQQDILENGYGSEYHTHRAEILKRSTFGTYAEPLLAALVVEVLTRKFLALLKRQNMVLPSVEEDLAVGLQTVSSQLVAVNRYDANQVLEFLVGPYSAIVNKYLGLSDVGKYVPLFNGTRPEIRIKHEVRVVGAELFASAIGLLGWGHQQRLWRLGLSAAPVNETIQLSANRSAPIAVAVVKGVREADAVLSSTAWTSGTDRMAILYIHDRPTPNTRSSSSRLGTARGLRNRYEVCWTDLVDHARDTSELAERFQTGTGL